MLYEIPQIINGKEINPSDRQLDIYDPVKGVVAGRVGIANSVLIDEAVLAAKNAFKSWSLTTPLQRAKILFRFKALLDQHIESLAQIVSKEHGKTLAEAMGSVQRGIDVVDFTCGIPNHLKGHFSENVSTDIDCYSLHQPLGVCVGITPFNFPAMIPLWMFPMAIACGNTFILKPSEKDPSCSVRLVKLAQEAGLPDGVVNVIHGDKEVVDGLLMHPEVNAVSFVGSSVVAEYVYKTAINHNKRVQAFGGAKNHCIVMLDADFDHAAEQLVAAAFGSAGERCMAISVVLTIGDETADLLIKKMTPRIKALQMGSGMSANVELGPLVTHSHWQRVQSYVDLGKKEGAKLIIDGSKDKPKECSSGFFMGPCLFDEVKSHMRIYKEEIFGPVLCIMRVATFDEALALINSHEYGNGTAIFTRDGYTARAFVEKVQVGMVGINLPVPVPVAYHSFGGWKRSIFSDIGMYGSEAIRFYTKLKTVTQRWFSRT